MASFPSALFLHSAQYFAPWIVTRHWLQNDSAQAEHVATAGNSACLMQFMIPPTPIGCAVQTSEHYTPCSQCRTGAILPIWVNNNSVEIDQPWMSSDRP